MRKKNPIDPLIEAKQAKIASFERALDKLRIEVSALEKARQALADHPIEPTPKRPKGNGQASGERRRRSLSDSWKRVLTRIGITGDLGATTQMISNFCTLEGIKIHRPSLRAQTFNYVKRGYLVRVGKGLFKLGPEGAKIIGAKLDSGESRKQTGAPREQGPGNAGVV